MTGGIRDADDDLDDEDTPILTTSEALSDPAGFVSGMTQEKRHCVFIPLGPKDAMARFSHADARFSPYTLDGVRGTVVTTPDKAFFNGLLDEFHTKKEK